jgi:hypothetical protein
LFKRFFKRLFHLQLGAELVPFGVHSWLAGLELLLLARAVW